MDTNISEKRTVSIFRTELVMPGNCVCVCIGSGPEEKQARGNGPISVDE